MCGEATWREKVILLTEQREDSRWSEASETLTDHFAQASAFLTLGKLQAAGLCGPIKRKSDSSEGWIAKIYFILTGIRVESLHQAWCRLWWSVWVAAVTDQ